MPKKRTITIALEMTIDKKSGKMIDIKPLDNGVVEDVDLITSDHILSRELKNFSLHTFLVGWGSPVCYWVPTENKVKKVCY